MNTFGSHFRLTTFGESHGPLIGGVIDGCPAGIKFDMPFIEQQLQRRQSYHPTSTPRHEADTPHFVSGIKEGYSTGAPIAFLIYNQSTRPNDYQEFETLLRPSHAHFTYLAKYGKYAHLEGGGRASARETAVRVVAGAIATQILAQKGIEIVAYTAQIGSIAISSTYLPNVQTSHVVASPIGCPHPATALKMEELLQEVARQGDTIGGVVATVVRGLPAGIGEPLYAKLDAKLAEAMLGINAAKAFEIGDGFRLATMRGSQANDPFTSTNGSIHPATNHSGGVLAGISTGAPLLFRTAFKPIPSISLPQSTVTTAGEPATLQIKGRHDTSVFPRVLPVVEAMTALTLINLFPHANKHAP